MPAGAVHAMRDVQGAVRSYLLLHPQAADTLVGIHQWWLPDFLRSTSIELIKLALTDMVTRGELRCDVLSDGSHLYALARPGDIRDMQ